MKVSTLRNPLAAVLVFLAAALKAAPINTTASILKRAVDLNAIKANKFQSNIDDPNVFMLKNMGPEPRYIILTSGKAGSTPMLAFRIPGYRAREMYLPNGFSGNFYSLNEGATPEVGTLVEMNIGEKTTQINVSGVDNLYDFEGVQTVFPLDSISAPEYNDRDVFGCNSWPCDNRYLSWNDDLKNHGVDAKKWVVLLGHKDKKTPKHWESLTEHWNEEQSPCFYSGHEEECKHWWDKFGNH